MTQPQIASVTDLDGRLLMLEDHRLPRLELLVDEHESELRSLPALTHQVQQLCLALGTRERVPLPDDWQEITQVKRPYLHKVQRQAKTRPWWAGAAVGLAWAVVELVKAIATGHISFH